MQRSQLKTITPKKGPWDKLSGYTRRYVLTFLDFEELASFQVVSKNSRELAITPPLWKSHYERHFTLPMGTDNCYQEFKKSYSQFVKDEPIKEKRSWLRCFKENKFSGVSLNEVRHWLDEQDSLGYPFAYWALRNNHQPLLDAIFKKCSNTNYAEFYCNQKNQMMELINNNKFRSDEHRKGSLRAAIQMGQSDAVEALIKINPNDINMRLQIGNHWPLSIAARLGHYDIAVFLLNHIKDTRLLDHALHAAAINNQIKMVSLLLEKGANPKFNYMNEMVFDVARHSEVKKLLLIAELNSFIQSKGTENKSNGLFKTDDRQFALKLKEALQQGTGKKIFSNWNRDKTKISNELKILSEKIYYLLENKPLTKPTHCIVM